MAAGDIILSDGTTITPEDLQKIAAETKKILAAESKELSQYEEASSLSNLTSLPGIFQSGSTMKLVRVALSVLKGVDGKTVELSASSTAIQWRYVGESEWNTLVDISLLKGDKGDAGEKVVLRKGESGIEWKYESEEDTAYKTLVSIDDIKLKYSDLSEADKAELTKKPILATVNAQSGSTPSGSFSSDGEDENGNPKYILNLTVQKGDKGEPPVFEVGSVTTGLPSSEASVELTPNGETPEGNPKYLMNISIPKGEPGQNGTGSGNVYATETGLEAGKTYLFRPSAPNSASGTFVLYEEPDNFPEAPDDGKIYGRNGKTKTWETILSEHTLDLSPLFTEEGSPVAAVSDEFLAELQKAYDEKYSNCILFGGNIPLMLRFSEGSFFVDVIFTIQGENIITYTSFQITISTSDKSVSYIQTQNDFDKSGSGTKALTDNGKYAEFVPEALKDGKQYARKNGEWVVVEATGSETYFIPASVMSMTSETSSEEVLAAFGGIEGFEKMIEAAKTGNIGVDYEITAEAFPAPVKYRASATPIVLVDTEIEGSRAVMLALSYDGIDLETGNPTKYYISLTRTGEEIAFSGITKVDNSTNLPNLDVKDEGLKGFYVRSNRIDVVNIFTELGYKYYRRIFLEKTEPYMPEDGDLWIQTT